MMNKNKSSMKFASIFLIIIALILWGQNVNAKIVVEGNRAFKDSVNECLNKYRGAEGLVGDAIKELEKSGNEHKITEGPEWENSANDAARAQDGTGSGSRTKVSASELEKVKEKSPELANKDFCTALLHEMWHAVDADRGSWSNAKKDGVWEDEIEATIFQNFIHAIRGVAARLKYGGVDISKYLGLTEAELNQAPSPASSPQASQTGVSTTMSFSHVAPGQYSEVYMDIIAPPGSSASLTLDGPAVQQPKISGTIESNGKLRLSWRIFQYGTYSASGFVAGQPVNKSVTVE